MDKSCPPRQCIPCAQGERRVTVSRTVMTPRGVVTRGPKTGIGRAQLQSTMDNAVTDLSMWTILSIVAIGLTATLWALGRIQRGWISSSARRRPSQGVICNAPGRISRFTIGCWGNVKGFELDSGVFAKTPPELGGTLVSLVPPQTKVLVSGY